MDRETFDSAIDGVDRWHTESIEKAPLVAEFIRDMISEESSVGEMTVAAFLEMLREYS